MQQSSTTLTFLFTDIEGSSRLWEELPDRMGVALARHDAILRDAVEAHDGRVVKMLGDGVNAVFDDPLRAVEAILAIQLALADPTATAGLALKVRSALHAGVVEIRDQDFFGSPVNRAARLMSAAHGGQVLLSNAVMQLLAGRLPRDVTFRDLGDARLRDLATPERVYQLAHPALRHDFPALRSLASTPNNLPLQLTSLVGREAEIADVRDALAKARLVTLVGPGGIGKTRIARHVAAESTADFFDGVWFVELAPLSDSQLVISALASALGIAEVADSSLLDSVVEHLAGQRALIVLDNCEHVSSACVGIVTRILGRAARVRILATSREALRLAAETVYVVPALSSPTIGGRFSVADLARCDASRLFIERAMAVHPAFRIDDANARSIAEICFRLDGIPLAIELAAARVRTLSVETIASRLSDRFRLLVGGDRAALPRQQTLRALIDWSYDTLTDGERILLRRLAVFSGGWTLESAEAVVAFGAIDRVDVLELQSNLVEKSLVALDPSDERYGMLETVKEYARERLAAADEIAEAHERHLAHYLATAETARRAINGADRISWLGLLDRERENMMASHRACDDAVDGSLRGLRLCVALGEYFYSRGALTVLHSMLLHALGRPQASERTRERARGLFEIGQLDCFMGRYADALRRLQECVEIANAIGDRRRAAEALQPLAMAAFGLGDLPTARAHLEQACALARESGDKREQAAALTGLVQVLRMDALFDRAAPLCAEVVAIARAIGDREVLAVGLLNLAMIEIACAHPDRAKEAIREIVDGVDATASTPILQSTLDVAAALACEDRDWNRAQRYFAVVEADRAVTGLKRDPADDAFVRPFLQRAVEACDRPIAMDPSAPALSEAIADVQAWLA